MGNRSSRKGVYMSRRRALLAIGAGGLLAVGMAWLLTPTPTGDRGMTQQRRDVLQEIDRPLQPHHDHEHQRPTPRPPATGTPLEREVVTHHPPLNDPQGWAARRAAAAEALQRQQLQATEQWAAAQGLPDEMVQRLGLIIDEHHSALRNLKAEVEQGTRSPAQLRQAVSELRENTQAQLEDMLGSASTEDLNTALRQFAGGGF